MKKVILLICGIIMLTTMVIGCSNKDTQTEEDLINRANDMIEKKYEVKIDKGAYTYELGGGVDEDNFIDIKEGEVPDVVFLRAVKKDEPSSGKVFNYSIKFNTKTDEIINSECEMYE
ncbi:MAG: hypothetical protein RSD98_13475 [Niameybacter sp.]